ncbi:hypothetical protein [Kitasatospora viridis]|nr:hypothetical protein [Kitasatospora viridis]
MTGGFTKAVAVLALAAGVTAPAVGVSIGADGTARPLAGGVHSTNSAPAPANIGGVINRSTVSPDPGDFTGGGAVQPGGVQLT